jgi:phosphoserine aminotransferase
VAGCAADAGRGRRVGVKEQGGVEAIEQRNIAKAAKLYQTIDQSSLYHNPVELSCRSRMNVPFILADDTLDKAFLAAAKRMDCLS